MSLRQPTLPSPRPMIDAEFLAEARRRRFTDVMAELCVDQGYRATTIAHVVTRARSSRNTVYEHFSGLEEIFLALLDRAVSELFERAEAACGVSGEDPLARVEAALAAILAWVAERPAMAWVCLVESICATEESFQRHRDALTRLTGLLNEAMPIDQDRPSIVGEALVGGIAAVLNRLLRSGETERAPALLGELSPGFLAPFSTRLS